jgi:hypothetical protein
MPQHFTVVDTDNAIRLRVGSAHNEREEAFPLPPDWRATICRPRDARALTAARVHDAFAQPAGMAPISVAARAAKHAVILVDDFRRPTPAEALCLSVIDELNAAGLGTSQLTVVVANGAHRRMTRREIRARLGRAIDRVGAVVSHDAFSPSTEFLGLTSAGTPVLVNDTAARADFSVAISTVYPHALTAWAGGAKMVLPGISHVSTIHCHHSRSTGGPWAGTPGRCPARRDIEEAASLFGLDVAVCAVMNSRRELCGLRVGDPTVAHRQAVAVARRVGRTVIDGVSPDLVISNAYPFDADPTQLSKAELPVRTFGVPVLIIADFADPSTYHGACDGPLADYRRRPQRALSKHTHEHLMKAGIFMYCPQYGDGYVPRNTSWYCDGDWGRLMAALARRFPAATVAVFPAAPIQIPEKARTVRKPVR